MQSHSLRRLISFSTALLAVAMVCFSLHARPAAKSVRTADGLVSGAEDQNGVAAYLGIPFAASPVGNLRWHPPEPAPKWSGIRQADHFGASCMQDEPGARLPWTAEFMTQGPVSEDCLFVNVWSSARASEAKQAVMVYIYGGGFTEGSGEVAVYNGENLARKGVVVVTFNYRVGALGFLVYPALTQESPNHSSGNYGLLDQIAALKWVHANIAAFGGDPARVTIFGQSAGAMSVAYLMRSPLAKGLFARAIAESGPGLFMGNSASIGTPLAQAEKRGENFAESKGAHSLAELRAMPAADFFKSTPGAPGASGMPASPGGPAADNWVVPEADPAEQVPVIVGMVSGDAAFAAGFGAAPPKTVAEYDSQAEKIYGTMAPEFLKLFPAAQDSNVAAALQASHVDRARVSIYLWAGEQAKHSPRVYTYFFDHPIPWPQHPEFGAFHTSEVPYIFENLGILDRPWQPIDHKLSTEMSSYWSNFAKSGDPNGAELPRWPEYHPESHTTMKLGAETGPIPIAAPARFAFFARFLEHH
jgi:para-nitrobenzyl esterase